jgi:hypothetical protein
LVVCIKCWGEGINVRVWGITSWNYSLLYYKLVRLNWAQRLIYFRLLLFQSYGLLVCLIFSQILPSTLHSHYMKTEYYHYYFTTQTQFNLLFFSLHKSKVIMVFCADKTHFIYFHSHPLSKFTLSTLFQISKNHFPTFLYLIINFSLSSFFIYNNKFFSLIFIYLIINFSLTFLF